jgi:hypothetical protein
VDHQQRAALVQQAADGRADALGAAGDENDFFLKSIHDGQVGGEGYNLPY